MDSLIRCENISKTFTRDLGRSLRYGIQDILREWMPYRKDDTALRDQEFWALRDVSFEVKRGECLGLVGSNGAGKTTLLKILSGILKPENGIVEVKGRVGSMVALGAGFDPVLSGYENILINAAILGVDQATARSKVEEILDFSELYDSIGAPVRTYSSGMAARLGFACAVLLSDPDVILLDEVLAVGDVNFQQKCLSLMQERLMNAAGIMVSHSPQLLSRICNNAIYLRNGIVVDSGELNGVLKRYNESRDSGVRELYDPSELVSGLDIEHPKIVYYGSDVTLNVIISLKEVFSFDRLSISIFNESAIGVAAIEVGLSGDICGRVGILIENICLPNGFYTFEITLYSKNEMKLRAMGVGGMSMEGASSRFATYNPRARRIP